MNAKKYRLNHRGVMNVSYITLLAILIAISLTTSYDQGMIDKAHYIVSMIPVTVVGYLGLIELLWNS